MNFDKIEYDAFLHISEALWDIYKDMEMCPKTCCGTASSCSEKKVSLILSCNCAFEGASRIGASVGA